MKRNALLMAVLAVCLISFTMTASALLKEMSKEDLITASEAIILGTVQEVHSAWADDRSGIYTYVTLSIEDQFKGDDLGTEVTVQIPGGKVGEITQVTSDTPQNLTVGTQVILHLFTKETGYYWVYGWEKGSLTVEDGTIPAYLMTVDQFRRLVEETLGATR